MFGDVINEQQLTDGLTVLMNRFLSRIEDEILANKRVVITIELQDKEERR